MSARFRPQAHHVEDGPGNGYHEKPRQDSMYQEPPMKSSRYNHNGHKITKHIRPEGESGRRGIHPIKFVKIVWKSSCTASKIVNVLLPFIPAAIAVHYVLKGMHLLKFCLCFVAMVPAANLLGFSGQEFARKLPKVAGIVLETMLGSIVEIVLFVLLLVKESQHSKGTADENKYRIIIQDAIMGSILANLLLCLGICFFVGGMKQKEQTFHDAVADTGSNLMLVAGFALVIPTVFYYALGSNFADDLARLDKLIERMSRATAIVLLLAFVVFVIFQCFSHKGLYDDILDHDEHRDADRDEELAKPKLTLTEALIVIVIALVCVCLIAFYLVEEIPYVVEEYGVSETFMGLILVPLVEKAAEHITAVDEAHDNQMNMALSHVLGASIQTALLNAPLVVLIGWGIRIPMTLDFQLFPAIVLILAILVVGGFLRDGKSNYLEGALSVLVYVLIAVAAFFSPNTHVASAADTSAAVVAHAVRSIAA